MENTINKAILSIGAAITGTIAPFIESVTPLRMPQIVMDLFQMSAWFGAFLIGLVAVIKYFRKKK